MPKIKKLSTTAVISTPCAQLFLPSRLPEESCSRPHTPMPQPPWHLLAPETTWNFVYLTNIRFKTYSVLSKSARDVQEQKSFSSLCNWTPLLPVGTIPTQFSLSAPVTLLGFFLSSPHPTHVLPSWSLSLLLLYHYRKVRKDLVWTFVLISCVWPILGPPEVSRIVW